jgi:hypothetical protein
MTTVWMSSIIGLHGSKEFDGRDQAITEIKAKGWRILHENGNELLVRISFQEAQSAMKKEMRGGRSAG